MFLWLVNMYMNGGNKRKGKAVGENGSESFREKQRIYIA